MAVSVYSASERDHAFAEINITPLVDVMLVLLVIFMMAVPTLTRTLPLRLPGESASQAIPPKQVLRVERDGAYLLDGRVLGTDDLDAALAAVASTSPETVIEIDASAESSYQAFTTALATVRENGLSNISLAR